MVHLETLNRLRTYASDHAKEHYKAYPGKIILFEPAEKGTVGVTILNSEDELKQAVNKYRNMFGPTYHIERIPEKTHRFNPDNLRMQHLDERIACCPNDGLTKLVSQGIVGSSSDKGHVYTETMECPDCGYTAFMPPTREDIEKLEEHSRTVIY
ncbi:MAG: hypothetical protein ACMXYK_03780 [Candidatus Woesearchaeota archaeon]